MVLPFAVFAQICGVLVDVQQLDFENKGGIWRNNSSRPRRAVAEVARNGELALSANFHSFHAFVPAFNNSPRTQWKRKRPSVAAGIEFLSVFEIAGVMDRDPLARNRFRAFANGDFFYLKVSHGSIMLCLVGGGSAPLEKK